MGPDGVHGHAVPVLRAQRPREGGSRDLSSASIRLARVTASRPLPGEANPGIHSSMA
jgi:hypothetical protein